jgi:hypothetical protein
MAVCHLDDLTSGSSPLGHWQLNQADTPPVLPSRALADFSCPSRAASGGSFGRKPSSMAAADVAVVSLKPTTPGATRANRPSNTAESKARLDLARGLSGTVAFHEAPVPSNTPAGYISLADRLLAAKQLRKRLHPASAMAAIYQLTRAVAHAAGLGVMHGSLNPGCIHVMAFSMHIVVVGWDVHDPWVEREGPTLE